MYHYGTRSQGRLSTCHDDLQRLANELIKHRDVTILEGHRGKEDQDRYFVSGRSKVKWPHGKHNKLPALAVDMAPYPIPPWAFDATNESERKMQRDFWVGWGNYVKGVAAAMGIRIRWGGDWNRDFMPDRFFDAPHFELEEE